MSMNTPTKNMMVEGKNMLGNTKQKMNQLSNKAQAEFRRALGGINNSISQVKAKGANRISRDNK